MVGESCGASDDSISDDYMGDDSSSDDGIRNDCIADNQNRSVMPTTLAPVISPGGPAPLHDICLVMYTIWPPSRKARRIWHR
jgi:hypothetical protein